MNAEESIGHKNALLSQSKVQWSKRENKQQQDEKDFQRAERLWSILGKYITTDGEFHFRRNERCYHPQ